MKKNKKILKILIIVMVILLIIIGIFLLIALNNTQNKNQETKTEEQKAEEMIQLQTQNLKSKGESQRIKEYLSMYLNYIEAKQYEKAYNLLYTEFKELYYPDLEMFIAYVENNYFDVMRIEFEDIQRQGQYYILSVELIDITEDLNSKQQKFVIYENGVNDFMLSFQAR